MQPLIRVGDVHQELRLSKISNKMGLPPAVVRYLRLRFSSLALSGVSMRCNDGIDEIEGMVEGQVVKSLFT